MHLNKTTLAAVIALFLCVFGQNTPTETPTRPTTPVGPTESSPSIAPSAPAEIPTEAPTMSTDVPAAQCKDVSVVLLLDASSSITPIDFKKETDWSVQLVERLFESGVSNISIVTFGTTAKVFVYPTDDAATIKNRLHNLQQSGGNTCIACAINQAITLVEPKNVAIVLTDGENNEGNLFQSLVNANSHALYRIAIGVGSGVTRPSVNVLASSLPNGNSLATFMVNDFDALNSVVDVVSSSACVDFQSVNFSAPFAFTAAPYTYAPTPSFTTRPRSNRAAIVSTCTITGLLFVCIAIAVCLARKFCCRRSTTVTTHTLLHNAQEPAVVVATAPVVPPPVVVQQTVGVPVQPQVHSVTTTTVHTQQPLHYAPPPVPMAYHPPGTSPFPNPNAGPFY